MATRHLASFRFLDNGEPWFEARADRGDQMPSHGPGASVSVPRRISK